MKILNPIRIIGAWVLLVIITDIIVIPALFYGTVGGEQRPLTFLMASINIMAYGVFILSILSIVLFFYWVKKHWFISLFFVITSGIYVFQDQKYKNENQYGFIERVDSVGGLGIRTRLEYYSTKSNRLRSRRYWKNGKKDSVWIIYSKEGGIVDQKRYKDDELVDQ